MWCSHELLQKVVDEALTKLGLKSASIKVFIQSWCSFFPLDGSVLFRLMGRVLAPIPAVYGGRQGAPQVIASPNVSLWGFSMLLKGTSAVLSKCLDTSPCYQNTFQKPGFEPTSLRFACPQDIHYEMLIIMLILHIRNTPTNVDLIWFDWMWIKCSGNNPCHTGSDNHVAFHPARTPTLAYYSSDQCFTFTRHHIRGNYCEGVEINGH